MLAALVTMLAVLGPLQEAQGLPRSGTSDRELEKLTEDVQEFFDGLIVDDRSQQQKALESLEEALGKMAKKAKVEGSMLRFVGDWELVFEQAKPEERSLKSSVGDGFFRHVFVEPFEQARVVALLSIPKDYDRSEALFPVVVALTPRYGVVGEELEQAVQTQAELLYGGLLDTHVVLIPLGPEQGEGRRAETVEIEGSWLTSQGLATFFTAYRILLEQVRFDRARVVLDGWGEVGLDALRLATCAPSYFAGVINRGGEVQAPDLVTTNLFRLPVLYVKGSESPEDVSALTGIDTDGVSVVVVEDPGTALAPAEETLAAVAEWVGERRRDLAATQIRYWPSDILFGAIDWCQATELNRRPTAKPSDADFPRIEARIDRDANTIDFDTVNILGLQLFLNDALVDLGKPVTIRVNGEEKLKKNLDRSLRLLLENRYYNNSGDYGLYTASVRIDDLDANVPSDDA